MNAKNSRFQFLITVLVALVPLAIASMIGMKVLGEEQEKNKHQDRQIEEIKEGYKQIERDLRDQAETNGRIETKTEQIQKDIDRILQVLQRRN